MESASCQGATAEWREDALNRSLREGSGVAVPWAAHWQSWDRKTKHFCGDLQEAPAPVLCSSEIRAVGKEKLEKLPLRELLEMEVSPSQQIPYTEPTK